MNRNIKIGVSSCLLGEKVRWNGGHKKDLYIHDILRKHFDYVSICPEVEIGMGTPRETVALYGTLIDPQIVSKDSKTDWTLRMKTYIKDRNNTLVHDDICGYIFKSKSPSCGLAGIPVYSKSDSNRTRHGPGIFSNAFIKKFPLVPTEDEERLKDSKIRDNFLVRVFCLHRFIQLINRGFSLKALTTFHTQHKYLLLAHSRKHQDTLESLISKSLKPSELKERYGKIFMEALTLKSTPSKNSDVLLHMMGFLKKVLTKSEKEELVTAIQDYRKLSLALIVPVTLIHHQAKKHNIEFLLDQVYLNPHPKELILRHLV